MVIDRFIKKNKNGFTYIELIAGMAVLILGVGFFTLFFRFSNVNTILAKEKMKMATAAQNMAQIYLSTHDADIAKQEGADEGYPDTSIDKEPVESYYEKVRIIINSKYRDESDPKYLKDYVLVFYAPVLEE